MKLHINESVNYNDWKESWTNLFYDGRKHRLPVYYTERYGSHPMVVKPKYNMDTDTLSYALYIIENDKERLIDDQFTSSGEAMEYGETYYGTVDITEDVDSEEYTDGVVNFSVPYDVTNLDELDKEQFDSLIDWCNDYLSGYGLEAYVQTTRHYQNELSLFYEIENLETTEHTEVNDTICQAVSDFFENENF